MKSIEKLALFDLDNTLIDSNYQITDAGLYEAVDDAQAAGWTVGLNSDTPYEALGLWRRRFGMNGPLVAEKGAVVAVDEDLVYDTADADSVSRSQTLIANYAEQAGLVLVTGNSVETLRSNPTIGKAGQTVLLLNTLSRCSLRFFVRVVSPDGSLAIDDTRANEVIADCRPLFPAFDDPTEAYHPDFGIFIASSERYTKRRGTRRLLGTLGLDRCVMVGDSMIDYLGDDIATHFAVANASEDYKTRASVVSKSITSGCVEILESLASGALEATGVA